MDLKKQIKFYENLIDLFPDIKRKGKTMPYTSYNGHMFSFMDKNGKMGLRLSSKERDKFIEDFNSSLMEQHGRIMKEYVIIPEELLENTNKNSLSLALGMYQN